MEEDETDLVIEALRAHVAPALGRDAMVFIEGATFEGDDWMLVDACLQFSLLVGHDIPDTLLDQVAAVIPLLTFRDDEGPRSLRWIRLIRELRTTRP